MITALIIVFVIGYLAIALEHPIRINKAATALITGVLCWTIFIVNSNDKELVTEQLTHHLGELSGILFFLLGAMTIVELIDAHDGFSIVLKLIRQNNKTSLLWIVAMLAFFLSAVLDNLTTSIVMVSLIRKLLSNQRDRLYFAGVIVIAANAGGAWSPIGDVTTTMLWIGGQITPSSIILKLIIPSLVCMILPLTILSFTLRGKVELPVIDTMAEKKELPRHQQLIVFFSGLLVLILVPVFKTTTHLPPYMGILLGLGILWIITEIIHGKKDTEDKEALSVVHALQKIDTPSVLFFFGILISIAALQSAHLLNDMAVWLSNTISNSHVIVLLLGFLSAIVDNVPLVAAVQGMYSLSDFPTNDSFWQFLAYCTGTGGSVLIIGSAAGVAAMGIEKIEFGWYLKNISWLALVGYLGGALVYVLQGGF